MSISLKLSISESWLQGKELKVNSVRGGDAREVWLRGGEGNREEVLPFTDEAAKKKQQGRINNPAEN